MKSISFDGDRRDAAVNRIRRYAMEELDLEIGAFAAERLLEFFAGEIGAFYYNQGLADAQAAAANLLDSLSDTIYSLEQREPRRR